MRHLLGVSLFRAVGLKHLPGSQWCWVRAGGAGEAGGWRSWGAGGWRCWVRSWGAE